MGLPSSPFAPPPSLGLAPPVSLQPYLARQPPPLPARVLPFTAPRLVPLPSLAAPVVPAGGGLPAAIKGGLGRLLPGAVLLLPLAIPALLEPFAPGVRDWLRDGWRHPGYGIPGSDSPGLSPVGGAAVAYFVRVRGRWRRGDGLEMNERSTRQTHIGPISSLRIDPQPAGPATLNLGIEFITGSGQSVKNISVNSGPAPNDIIWLFYEFEELVRVDGAPEGVPDPLAPPVTTPSPLIQNPKPAESPYFPNPQRETAPDPRQRPETAPPSPTPAPLPSPRERPGGLPLLPPQTSPNPAVSPSPSPGSAGAGAPQPTPLPPPSAAPNPAPRAKEADEECLDPCALRGAKILDFLKDKIEEALEPKDSDGCPPCPPVPDITYPIVTTACNDGRPRLTTWTLQLREPAPSSLRAALDAMASLAAEACNPDSVVAFPDWWQTRIGSMRPQIVLSYRSGGTSDYRSISLPHPANTTKWTSNLLGNYRAGSVHGVLTLKDNSKFIVNCVTEAEAERMIAIARTLIDPSMMDDSTTVAITKKRGRTVEERMRVGASASYFPDGQRDFSPRWKAIFRLTP